MRHKRNIPNRGFRVAGNGTVGGTLAAVGLRELVEIGREVGRQVEIQSGLSRNCRLC